jgi:uncharacterized protein YdbL (DUF1318 family)
MKTRRWLMVAMLLLVCLAGVARADDRADDQALRELKQRFMERFPTLVHLRREGKIGETWDGWTRPVRDEYRRLRLTSDGRIDDDQSPRNNDDRKTVGELLDEENADRTTLYRIIARKQSTTPQVVARRNAQRLFDQAEVGTYLKKDADSDWQRKPKPEDDDDRR